MKKKLIAATIIPSMVLSMGLGLNSGSVSAAETEPVKSNLEQTSQALSSEDIKSLNEFFNTYNVKEETQNQLIAKLKKGKIWDSIKKDEKPVSTYEVPSKENENIVETVSIYKDGSISVAAIEPTIVEDFSSEIPTNGTNGTNTITPYAVNPGTVTGGSGYKNYTKAKAYVYSGIANAHFYANFTLIQGGYDKITNVYDYKIVGVGGTTSYDSLRITRATETSTYKASAKLDFTWVAFNGSSSSTCWLKLNVGRDSYGTTHSY